MQISSLMCTDRQSPPVLNRICLPCLLPFHLVTSLFLLPYTLFSCLSTVTSFLYVHFYLLFLINSLTLQGIAKHVLFVIFSYKKEHALFFDWKISLFWIPPTLPEGSTLTIKLWLFLLLAVVLMLVERCIIHIYASWKSKWKRQIHYWDFVYCAYVRKLAFYTWKDCKRIGKNYDSVFAAVSWNPEERFLLEKFQNKTILLRNAFEANLCYFVVGWPY